MKVRLTVLSLFLLCFLIAGCVPAQQTKQVAMPPAPPPAPVYEKGIVKTSARLRESPSKQAKVLNTVAAGTEVKIIQTLDSWYKISTYDGREGYVYDKLVQISSSGSTAALAPVNTPPGRIDPPITYFVIRDARLRSGPGAEYKTPNITVKAGAQFTADGYSGSWYHGSVLDKSGWLNASLLDNKHPSKRNSQETVPQQNKAVNKQPQPPIAGTPVEPSPPAQQQTPPQSTASSQPSQAPVPVGKAHISSLTPVKLRSHPNQFGKVIEEIPAGSEVMVLENQGNWYKIKTAHNTGFVTSDNLSLGGK